MSLLTLVLVCAFVGAALWLLLYLGKHGSPLLLTLARVAIGLAVLVAVIALLIWALDYFGAISILQHVRVPGPRR